MSVPTHGTSIELSIAPDHPAYPGHFPGMPILPGAALLDQALHALESAGGFGPRKWRIASVKFLAPVKPGDALQLSWSASGDASIRFVIRSVSRTVASGMLSHGA